MIHITRTNCPSKLINEKTKLTQEFINNGSSVWGKSYIKSALLEMSHNKCAYCECKLDEESKYIEVEHFLPKNVYPQLVVDWNNLLPSCKRCNGKKGTHDSQQESIIDPTVDIPNNHIKMFNYLIKGKDMKGKTTVDVLHLNQLDRLVQPRMLIGTATIETVEILLEMAENFCLGNNTTTRIKRRIVNGTSQLLVEAQPHSQYSATVASVLFTNEDFFKLKKIMIKCELWDTEHQDLLSSAEENILVEPLQVSQ
ncbi:HNH endonuclease [Bacillus toyonensis]|uniref:HNH endonuclease n=1 Tax=Bacillus toyonensis TaxID=155322 RepID=UPI001CD2A689|nr:HNH endonuclease [Bacillus toyonensis]MCA1042900.1 HNH endonuclease [Bacillus toyonensis]